MKENFTHRVDTQGEQKSNTGHTIRQRGEQYRAPHTDGENSEEGSYILPISSRTKRESQNQPKEGKQKGRSSYKEERKQDKRERRANTRAQNE